MKLREKTGLAQRDLPGGAPPSARTRKVGEPLKLTNQQRFFPASDIAIERKDNVTRMSFAASSEAEVERWWGTEVLSHDAESIRMDRIRGGAVPVLFNHNYDMPVGMVEGARIEKKRLVVDTKWLSTDDAQRVEQMVSGGLRNVSIGYRIHAVEEETKTQRYTATDWEPLEVSIVTVPADSTVGIGRSNEDDEGFEVRVVARAEGQEAASPERTENMLIRGHKLQNQEAARSGGGGAPDGGAAAAAAAAAASASAAANGGAAPDAQVRVTGGDNKAAALETSRINAIRYFAQANAIPDNIRDHWINTGSDVESVGREIVAIQQQRNATAKPASYLDMEAKDKARFSIARAIHAVSSNNWTKAGLEAAASREVQERMGFQTDPNKFYVPLDIQERQHRTPIESLAYQLMVQNGKRDLTVASAGAGGYLVETANVGFVELLRNRSVAFQMGATRMPGMVGNLTIPKQSAAGTAYWLSSESTQITESQQTFVQIALSPKTVGGYTEISRQLLLQSSPAAEGLVMSDLAAIVALAADLAILSGTGASGQPTGITATSGIGAVTGTSLAYAGIIEFQTDTAAGNALFGNSGYVTTPAVAGLLKQRVKFSSTASPLWDGQLLDANVDGYRGMASNQLAAASMLFGAFSSVLVPEWGVLAIEVNPFANFQAGIVGVRAMYTMDVGVRYPTAFSLATSIT